MRRRPQYSASAAHRDIDLACTAGSRSWIDFSFGSFGTRTKKVAPFLPTFPQGGSSRSAAACYRRVLPVPVRSGEVY